MPRKPRASQKPGTSGGSAVASIIRPPSGLRQAQREEFERIVVQYRERLGPEDADAIAQLACVRVQARAVSALLEKQGPTVESRGSRKRNPALAALVALRSDERGLVSLLGLQKANPSLARQAHVAQERERLARHIDATFAAPGGDLLAGYPEWAAEELAPGQISQIALKTIRAYFGMKS